MNQSRSLRIAVVLLVLAAASCLAFWTYVVFERTILADGLLVVMQDGAEAKVTGTSLYVLAGSADSPRFSPLFPYVAAGVYLVLVLLALRGAASLFRPRSSEYDAPIFRPEVRVRPAAGI